MMLFAALATVLALGQVVPQDVKDSVRVRVESGYNAGVVVGVIDGAGKTEYFALGATAHRDDGAAVASVDDASVFEIGSITKVFTSLVLATMVGDDLVTLDDPVQEHLPEAVKVPVRNGEVIRLVHLATHTSGLPRMPSNFAPKDAQNPYADYSVEQMYDFLSHATLQSDIGAKADYSNLGAGLLGHVLTLVAQKPYEELVTERVLGPLSMSDTRITLTQEMSKRLARGHTGVLEAANWDLPTLAGAGALRSTARDMLKFLAAQMKAATGSEHGALADAMRLTHAPRHELGTDQIGLGWIIRKTAHGTIHWHNGGTGGYRSFAGFRDDGSLGVVVLTNSSDGCDDVGFHVLDEKQPLARQRPTVPVDVATLDLYAGKYQLASGAIIEVARRGRSLVAQLTGQSWFTIYPEAKDRFFYTVVPATLTFKADAAGQTTSVVLHQGGVDQPATRMK